MLPDYGQPGVLLQGLCKALPSLRGDAIESQTREEDTGDGLLQACPQSAWPSTLGHLGSFCPDTAPGRKQGAWRISRCLRVRGLKRPGRDKGRTPGFAFELKAQGSWGPESGLCQLCMCEGTHRATQTIRVSETNGVLDPFLW